MTLKNILYELCKILFSNGWFFFIPYFVFYLCFDAFHLNVVYLYNIFILLHIINSFLFTFYICIIYRNKKLSKFLFWIFIILLFLIPGAYLEFPSDAWAHFQRIFSWQTSTFLDSNPVSYKFTYFWGWTLMSQVEPLYRRSALDIYSSFWQFLLAYQFYLFALRVGFSEVWAKVQVVGTICLFGTNVFGFYRYYALSSTPLAYIAYLHSLIGILDLLDGKKKKISIFFYLICLIFVIYYNHYQELVLLGISATAICILNIFERTRKQQKKNIIYLGASIFVTGFIIGALAVTHYQQYANLVNYFWQSYLKGYFRDKEVLYWTKDAPMYWSSWGILRIWDTNLPYYQTLGIHGCISLLFSFVFWKKHRLLACLTVAPLLILLFQPFTLFIAAIDGHYTTFRVLYAFPHSFMLIIGIKETFEYFTKKIGFLEKNYLIKGGITVLTIILLSCQPGMPWRGRLWFQFYKPPAQLSLENLDVTAQWFFKNRPFGSQSLVVSDNATGFVLATHFGSGPTERLLVYNPSQEIRNFDSLNNYLESRNVWKFLVGIPSKMTPIPVSEIGQLSEHWLPDLVKQDLNYSKELIEATSVLESLGWTKTFVPPFYWLYEYPMK